MIGVTDRLTALTVEHILAESKEIAYTSGDTTVAGNTIADQITLIHKRKLYGTEDDYEAWKISPEFDPDAEYNVYEN